MVRKRYYCRRLRLGFTDVRTWQSLQNGLCQHVIKITQIHSNQQFLDMKTAWKHCAKRTSHIQSWLKPQKVAAVKAFENATPMKSSDWTSDASKQRCQAVRFSSWSAWWMLATLKSSWLPTNTRTSFQSSHVIAQFSDVARKLSKKRRLELLLSMFCVECNRLLVATNFFEYSVNSGRRQLGKNCWLCQRWHSWIHVLAGNREVLLLGT